MSLSKLFPGTKADVKVEHNGVKRAKKVPRKGSRTFQRSKNIAAIDFGTKNCSLAYITENDTTSILKTGVPKLPLNGTFLRVPTAILFNPEGHVLAFGHDARTLYGNLQNMEYSQYFYFEEIKMKLHDEQEISRDMKIHAANGKEFYLVDVIAHILRYLKDALIEDHLGQGGHSFHASNFDWVISVPAIWRARGKQMMREAGYKAGLCSMEGCGRLRVCSGQPLPLPDESSPDKLSLALEPESASLYCHEMLKRGLVAPHCDKPGKRSTSSTYLMVDIGGGTVDISSHRILKEGSQLHPVVEELHQPVGNDCGGSRVNKEFLTFLGQLTGDPELSMYINSNPDVDAINRYELNEIINVTFEEQKQTFGRLDESVQRDIVIRLPPSFLEVYRTAITENLEKHQDFKTCVTLERRSLRISQMKMKQFFTRVIEDILSLLTQHLRQLTDTIEVIYLVGGFGGCPYLYTKIMETFGDQCQIIVPPNPELAVVEGAALFHYFPSFVHARRADATYGKSVIRPFNYFVHDRQRRIEDSEGRLLCQNLFQTIVEIGELINPDFVYTCTSIPVSCEQANIYMELFSSLEKSENITYTCGNESRGALKIGELVVDLPQRTDSTQRREVDFTFDFSHTEIKVVGFEKRSHLQVKTIVDFLTVHI